jgi:hypothetical protein
LDEKSYDRSDKIKKFEMFLGFSLVFKVLQKYWLMFVRLQEFWAALAESLTEIFESSLGTAPLCIQYSLPVLKKV